MQLKEQMESYLDVRHINLCHAYVIHAAMNQQSV